MENFVGFRRYAEAPVFLFEGKTERDFWEYSTYWFISDRMKTALERIDPKGFSFLKCKVKLRNGGKESVRWLCEIKRVLDALDEKESAVRIGTDDRGRKNYRFGIGDVLRFKDEVVGPHHVFRMMYFEPLMVCDEAFRLACKTAGFKGISFVDRAKRR